MKKIYHYLYTLDDRKDDHSDLLELNPDDPPDPGDSFSDVFAYLDRYSFDVDTSVVKRLVKFAESRLRGL